MVALTLALFGSYLVGSIPTAYLVVKRIKGVDVRTVGSGNVGATNVTRSAGVAAGALVFIVDCAKGLVAVTLVAPWLLHPMQSITQFACGVMAVIGHAFPLFLNFRGGKGVATTIGVLIGATPVIAGICLAVWLICFLIWRYVSLASLVAVAMIPVVQLLIHRSRSEFALGMVLTLLIIMKHRGNIERLLQRQEHRWTTPREATSSSEKHD